MRILINLPIQRCEADAQGKTSLQIIIFYHYHSLSFSLLFIAHRFIGLFPLRRLMHRGIEDQKAKTPQALRRPFLHSLGPGRLCAQIDSKRSCLASGHDHDHYDRQYQYQHHNDYDRHDRHHHHQQHAD